MDQKIYIMLSRTGTKFSKLLRLFTRAPYNHVSIALDENLDSLYSFGRRHLYIPILAGFVKEDVNDGIYHLYKDTRCEVYCMTISNEQYQKLKKLIERFEREGQKYRYNFFGLGAMLFNIPLHREHHYVCSQFVAYLLQECDLVDLDKDFSLVRPHELSDLPDLNLVYSGLLTDYST